MCTIRVARDATPLRAVFICSDAFTRLSFSALRLCPEAKGSFAGFLPGLTVRDGRPILWCLVSACPSLQACCSTPSRTLRNHTGLDATYYPLISQQTCCKYYLFRKDSPLLLSRSSAGLKLVAKAPCRSVAVLAGDDIEELRRKARRPRAYAAAELKKVIGSRALYVE